MKFSNETKYKDCSGIYMIVNTTNKHVYVGQTKMRFVKRYWHHVWKLNNGSHDNHYLQNAWNKYGEDSFVFRAYRIIDRNEPQKVFDELEEEVIAACKNRGGCYNILDCGTRKNMHCSEHAKKIIGEKNRINMLGKKHSEETRRKMSERHKNARHTRYKITNVTNDEEVRQIKLMLMKGVKSSEIVKQLNTKYKTINSILSNNSWANVYVEGWEEFQATRKRLRLATDEEKKLFYNLYHNQGWTIHRISTTYHRSYDLVKRVVNLVQDNPVPSLCEEEGQTTIP